MEAEDINAAGLTSECFVQVGKAYYQPTALVARGSLGLSLVDTVVDVTRVDSPLTLLQLVGWFRLRPKVEALVVSCRTIQRTSRASGVHILVDSDPGQIVLKFVGMALQEKLLPHLKEVTLHEAHDLDPRALEQFREVHTSLHVVVSDQPSTGIQQKPEEPMRESGMAARAVVDEGSWRLTSREVPPYGPSREVPPYGPSREVPPHDPSREVPPYGPSREVPPYDPSREVPPYDAQAGSFVPISPQAGSFGAASDRLLPSGEQHRLIAQLLQQLRMQIYELQDEGDASNDSHGSCSPSSPEGRLMQLRDEIDVRLTQFCDEIDHLRDRKRALYEEKQRLAVEQQRLAMESPPPIVQPGEVPQSLDLHEDNARDLILESSNLEASADTIIMKLQGMLAGTSPTPLDWHMMNGDDDKAGDEEDDTAGDAASDSKRNPQAREARRILRQYSRTLPQLPRAAVSGSDVVIDVDVAAPRSWDEPQRQRHAGNTKLPHEDEDDVVC